MRILMFGMFDRTYPRNRVVLAAMRSRGIEVVVCHEPVWELTRDKERGYHGLLGRARLVLRILYAYLRLTVRLFNTRGIDAIWVGFPGHADVPFAWLVGKVMRKPVVFDAFISWYDSAVRDRKMFRKQGFTSELLKRFDVVSTRLADRVVLDTPQHARFFHDLFGVDLHKLGALPVGADESVFYPRPAHRNGETHEPRPFTVLQYAEFSPLHGGAVVLDAAKILEERGANVRFELIGDGGPLELRLRERAKAMGLASVRFNDYMPESELVQRIAGADVCLGIFGATPKARRVVPNKVYQCMAMRKAIITGDTPAMRDALEHGREAWLSRMADAEALADAIVTLRDDPALRERLAAGARRRFEAEFTVEQIGRTIERQIELVLAHYHGTAATEAIAAVDA